MYKKFLSLFMILLSFVAIGNVFADDFEITQNTDVSTEYTEFMESVYEIINSPNWKTMSRRERGMVCQLPSELIDTLTTKELIQTTLDYPFFIDIYAFNTVEMGYNAVLNGCNVLQTLVSRTDRADAVLEFYDNAHVVSALNTSFDKKQYFDLDKLELLIVQDDFTAAMTDEQKDRLIDIAENKYLEKTNYSDLYGVNADKFFKNAATHEALASRITESSVYVPNESKVTVFIKWQARIPFATNKI